MTAPSQDLLLSKHMQAVAQMPALQRLGECYAALQQFEMAARYHNEHLAMAEAVKQKDRSLAEQQRARHNLATTYLHWSDSLADKEQVCACDSVRHELLLTVTMCVCIFKHT